MKPLCGNLILLGRKVILSLHKTALDSQAAPLQCQNRNNRKFQLSIFSMFCSVQKEDCFLEMFTLKLARANGNYADLTVTTVSRAKRIHWN